MLLASRYRPASPQIPTKADNPQHRLNLAGHPRSSLHQRPDLSGMVSAILSDRWNLFGSGQQEDGESSERA